MSWKSVHVEQFICKPFDLWDRQWLLLTSGDYSTGEFNCMTVGWGSFGIMWRRPFAQVVVRPTRYTYQFMDRFSTFTLCAFPDEYRKALKLLGSRSGRDGDKIAPAGITPIPSQEVAAPAFAEAELSFECETIYWQDMEPSHFKMPSIEALYPKKDYHRIYFGHILNILRKE